MFYTKFHTKGIDSERSISTELFNRKNNWSMLWSMADRSILYEKSPYFHGSAFLNFDSTLKHVSKRDIQAFYRLYILQMDAFYSSAYHGAYRGAGKRVHASIQRTPYLPTTIYTTKSNRDIQIVQSTKHFCRCVLSLSFETFPSTAPEAWGLLLLASILTKTSFHPFKRCFVKSLVWSM
jgi:hypothetical protein